MSQTTSFIMIYKLFSVFVLIHWAIHLDANWALHFTSISINKSCRIISFTSWIAIHTASTSGISQSYSWHNNNYWREIAPCGHTKFGQEKERFTQVDSTAADFSFSESLTFIVFVNLPKESTTPPNVEGWIATAQQLVKIKVHRTQIMFITFIIRT